jgi:hypothetical protein
MTMPWLLIFFSVFAIPVAAALMTGIPWLLLQLLLLQWLLLPWLLLPWLLLPWLLLLWLLLPWLLLLCSYTAPAAGMF